MTPALEEARRLLRLARRDQATFNLLVPLDQAPMAALGFHAQQTVEKSLKSVCTLRGLEVRRTHDLAALAQSLADDGCVLPLNIEDLRALNPFAVEYRYDDELVSALTRDALQITVTTIIRWAGRCVDS